jgi:hypothetical protein
MKDELRTLHVAKANKLFPRYMYIGRSFIRWSVTPSIQKASSSGMNTNYATAAWTTRRSWSTIPVDIRICDFQSNIRWALMRWAIMPWSLYNRSYIPFPMCSKWYLMALLVHHWLLRWSGPRSCGPMMRLLSPTLAAQMHMKDSMELSS